MIQKWNISKWPTLLLICAALVLSGCVTIPTGKYEVLKDSSQILLANTAETYTRIEKMQRQYAIVKAPNLEINTNTFKPQIEGQSFDITPELRFRESAFEVLVKYTNLLYLLSSKDYLSDVDKASEELAGSLQNLMETSKAMGEDNASKASGIAAALLDIVGKQIVEHQRLSALKEAMDSAQADIETLSKLITGSNKKISGFVQIMLDGIIAHANAERPAYATLGRTHFDTEIADTILESEEINASLETMNNAISKIPEAHKEIRNELDKKQATFDALRSLVGEAQRANKFYRNLDKK